LGQHVGDFFRPTGVVAALLALSASGEVGGGGAGTWRARINGWVLNVDWWQ
jgi:hypothetical protein